MCNNSILCILCTCCIVYYLDIVSVKFDNCFFMCIKFIFTHRMCKITIKYYIKIVYFDTSAKVYEECRSSFARVSNDIFRYRGRKSDLQKIVECVKSHFTHTVSKKIYRFQKLPV